MSNFPTKLGPYQLEEEIGRGGMSVVFRAVDTRNGRKVALKVLPPEFAHNPTFLNRFVKEGESAVKLRHPNIMRTFEANQAGAYHYIAMELAVKGTLSDRMKAANGMLPEREILDVLRQAAAGLDHAHTLGLLHRDIKPSNIMFAGADRVVIADFGVAKDLLSEHTQVTMPGFSVGTPAYMSPEQARGDLDLDRRADVYSLGVVAYSLLTGKMPFDAPSQLVLLRKIVDESPKPPEEVNPNIHPGAAYVLTHALAKDPDARYQSATEFVAHLQHALQQPRWETGAGIDATMAMIPIPGGGPPPFTPASPGKKPQPPAPAPIPARRPTPPPAYYAPSSANDADGVRAKPKRKGNRLLMWVGAAAGLVIIAGVVLFFSPDLLSRLAGESADPALPAGQVAGQTVAEPADAGATEPVRQTTEGESLPGETPGSSSDATDGVGQEQTILLLEPEDQSSLAAIVAQFSWQTSVELDEGEALEMLIWPQEAGLEGWTEGISAAGLQRDSENRPDWQATVDLLGLDRAYGVDFEPGDYYWGVARVVVQSYARLGLESDVRHFSYTPDTSATEQTTVAKGCAGVLCSER